MKSYRLNITAALTATILFAASGSALAFDDLYVRGEVGGTWQNSDSASWTSPGSEFQAMNLDTSGSPSAGVAIGGYFVPNIRGDLSYTYLGHFDLASCRISGSGQCGQSRNTGSVNSHLFMANAFVEAPQPFMVGGASVTPFATVGIGAALHDFGMWNHVGQNTPAAGHDYNGANKWDFAWTVGAGASVDVSGAMNRPAFVDVTWRYTDAGNAKGGTTPDHGSGFPDEAYNADIKTHSIFVGLRMPLGK